MRAQELFDRVAAGAGVDGPAAQRAARAVLVALAQALPRREAMDMAAQLADPLQDWMQESAGQEALLDREAFLRRVAELCGDGTSPQDAERLSRAVLGALQDAVSFGNIADSVMSLPGGIADLVGTRPA